MSQTAARRSHTVPAGLTREVVSPFRACILTVAVSVGLIAVLAPVLPGETPVNAGDVAYKTFIDDGLLIASEGELLTDADVREIRAAGLNDNHIEGQHVAAAVIVAVLSAAMLGLYLYLFQPREVNTAARLALVGLLFVVWVAVAKVFLSQTLPDSDRMYLAYMLPVAAVPMLVGTLLDAGLAIAVACLLAGLATFAAYSMPDARNAPATGVLAPLQMALAFLLAGLAGTFAVLRATRMNHYILAGAIVGSVTAAVLLAVWLIDPDREGIDVAWLIAAAAIGGIASAVVTIGATVVLGFLFGVTTRIQLMELSQLTHPLLRQLQERAPGTFHHSVIVGNLGERAAYMIGADALLVRVGSFFHDIGKIAKPEFYIENQQEAGNPHDRLQPAMSARMVAEHVSMGKELAARYRLPSRVRAFIPEHHGTRLVTYFYRRAVAVDPATDPEKFRYPGPRPQSKETAIVMLADSVEAVVRASKDRSNEKIDELVDGVIAERVAEGQFDECDLTMRDLRTIAESFKATLRGIYHARIEYPEPSKSELHAVASSSGIAYLKPPANPVE